MKNIIRFSVFALLLSAGCTATSAYAENSVNDSFSLGVQAGALSGQTAYHISQYAGSSGVESELKFPLQTVLAGARMGFRKGFEDGRNELKLSVSWMKNMDSGSGKVKDSDWLTNDQDLSAVGAAHSGLDIYSESDMRLKADVYDLRAVLGMGIGEHFKIGPMLGYKHQSFRYDISNVNQIGYGPYAAAYTGSVRGLVGTYKIEYDMPYLGVVGEFKKALASGDLTATAQVGIAYVTANDRDDHILRSKLSTTSATGTAFFAELGTAWTFFSNWSLGINGEFLSISADGIQDQNYYAGAYAGQSFSIDSHLSSTQVTVIANLGYQF